MKSGFSKFLTYNFIICLLGNFVDQFDLYLFSSLRVLSLQRLGLNSEQILSSGVQILNAQMIGMLLGGVVAGILGDRRGRVSVLFGSIALYSIANIANACVTTVSQYAACRFLAGLGLAGELGVCITVVVETLPIGLRGYGTMLVMAFGHVATILSSLTANYFDWRACYLMGGLMGLAILVFRSSAVEPPLYLKIQKSSVEKGRFLKIFQDPALFKRYLLGILVSCPTWYTFSVLIIFAPELGRELGIQGEIRPEKYLIYNFSAVVLGDLCGGILAQKLKSRRWIIFGYLVGLSSFSWIYLSGISLTLKQFYVLMGAFGFFAGYAVLSYTLAAEQFGTNLRSTVATSTPNWVRASAVLFTSSFLFLKTKLGAVQAASWIGCITFTLAFLAIYFLPETQEKNLDYLN